MAKNVASVEDFQAIANDMGLVPMRFLIPTITEMVGDIRGAEPYTALRWYSDGLAEPIRGLTGSPAPKRGQSGPTADEARRSAVEIAAGWKDEHHLSRIGLAKKIVGSDDAMNTEAADAAIQAELDRRAAAA